MENEEEWNEEMIREINKDPLSDKERKMLSYVKHMEGIFTIRQAQEAIGFSSTSVVHHYIQNLVKKGFISATSGYKINFED